MALTDITLGQYLPADSRLHSLDPRSKLLSCLSITTCLLLTQNWIATVGIAAVCVWAMRMSNVPFAVFFRNLKWFVWLFIITFAIHLIELGLVAGFPFVEFGLKDGGLFRAVLFTTRLILLVTAASLLTLTTSPLELTDSLERLLRPLKRVHVPVHEFALMMSLSLRFVPILLRESERIKNAQLSRGVSLEGSLIHRAKSIVPMILPLFVSAIRKADDLAVAMQARNYRGGEGRSSFSQLVWRRADSLVIGVSVGLIVATIILR